MCVVVKTKCATINKLLLSVHVYGNVGILTEKTLFHNLCCNAHTKHLCFA